MRKSWRSWQMPRQSPKSPVQDLGRAIQGRPAHSIAGTKFKIVLGYPGAAEMGLAMEKGDIKSHTAPWAAWKAAHPDWIRDKKVDQPFCPVLTHRKRNADLPRKRKNDASAVVDDAQTSVFEEAIARCAN